MLRLARIDRWFRRFLRTGDARALGRVFDATAPELLKIAAYLAGDRQQAEDLVHSAFLVALERRAEFDARRSVMPWLCGIVANLARAERRRAHRPTGRAAAGAAPDPVAAAEWAEFRAAFEWARDGLSRPYRPVLELYLEHGLGAGEIARLLDRPAGTVRAQIARGLDALRKRLPRGFVAGSLAAATATATLRAMRADLLSRAGATASSPALAASGTAALIGGGTMNKNVVVAAALGASLLALGVWLAGSLPAGGGDRPPALPGAAPLTARAGEAAPAPSPAAEPVREAVASEPAAEARAGGIEVTARWQGDLAPAVRQAIEVVCAGASLAELRPRRALTDGEGRCRFEQIPAGAATVFASTGARAEVAVEGGRTTAVELELDAWGVVRGVVEDQDGRRVPDADVWVSSEIRYRALRRGDFFGHGQHGGFALRTDAEGRFATRLAFMQCLAAFKAGYGPSPTLYPCVGRAPPGGIDVTLRLAAEGSVLVVEVHGASGAPVEGAHVVAGSETPHFIEDEHATTPALRANTDEHGLVELAPLPAGTVPVQVRAPGFAPWRGRHELPPSGTARLAVQLEAAAVVYGVVTGPDGAPVGGALLSHGRISELASSSCTSAADGSFVLADLPSGTVELTAWKAAVGSCQAELVLEAGARHEWRPALSTRPAITGIVLDPSGRPLAGASVFCSSSELGQPGAHGETDARGRFMLGPLAKGAVYDVRAELVDPAQGLLLVVRRGVAPGTDLELQAVPTVAATAHLRGRLLAADGTPVTQVQMVVQPVNGSIGDLMRIEQSGEFASGPHRPGRVRITVMARGMKTIADLGEHELRAGETLDLGNVYLPTPGGAVLRVAGGDVVQGVANLFRGGELMDSRRIKGQEIEWPELPPGDYRVCVRRGGPTPFAGAGAFAVQSGATTRAELQVAPAQWRELRVGEAGERRRSGLLTAEDESGREVLRDEVTIPPAGETERVLLPAGKLRLRLRTADGFSGETRATVPGEGAIEIALSPR